jgi:hypothetical protein
VWSGLKIRKKHLLHPDATRYIKKDKTTDCATFKELQEAASIVEAEERKAEERHVAFAEGSKRSKKEGKRKRLHKKK